LPTREELSASQISLTNLTPTPRQRRLALLVAVILFFAFGVTAPFSATPLPRLDAFIPALESTIFVTGLITAVLLFAQFAIYPSRGLLAIASGYLFTALIVIPHMLTFPGAFSPTGLLGAGLQSTVWLYLFWHIGFPAALFFYVLLNDIDRTKHMTHRLTQSAILWSMAIVLIVVCGLAWVATAGEAYLPQLFLDTRRSTPLLNYVFTMNVLVGALVLVMLWFRQHSVLDQWLLIAGCTLIAEQLFGGLLSGERFSLGFYAGRIFSLVTATVVLIVLLAETARLYTRLARSNTMLQREQNNKLMNLEAMVATISHEVRQPLAAIMMNGDAALQFLKDAPPNIEEARSALNDIVGDGHRANDVFASIRALFRSRHQERQAIDLNQVAIGVLNLLRAELKEHRVTTRTELMTDLPLVMGHKGQLQEVILNLVHNAIEAMDTIKDGRRVLRLRTEYDGGETITVAVEDSGPGIDPKTLDGMFDAFVTTKTHGLGLGLAICRMIIERHEGKLEASSDNLNGALFQFTLPIKPVEDAEAAQL
jgi:signal transduction histidine kinase